MKRKSDMGIHIVETLVDVKRLYALIEHLFDEGRDEEANTIIDLKAALTKRLELSTAEEDAFRRLIWLAEDGWGSDFETIRNNAFKAAKGLGLKTRGAFARKVSR